MELQKQVCSLELAKRLEELGVRQESIWEWSGNKSFGFKIKMVDSVRNLLWDKSFFEDLSELAVCRSNYSAFTVGELGEMLPTIIQKEYSPRYEIEYDFPIKNDRRYTDNDWVIRYRCVEDSFKNFGVSADNEADARAKMLIYLLEKKLITL